MVLFYTLCFSLVDKLILIFFMEAMLTRYTRHGKGDDEMLGIRAYEWGHTLSWGGTCSTWKTKKLPLQVSRMTNCLPCCLRPCCHCTLLCSALLYLSCPALAYRGSSGSPEYLDPGRRRGKGTRQSAGPQEAKKTRAGGGRWGCRGGAPGGGPAGGCAAEHTPTAALLAGFLHSRRSHPSASPLHCSLHVPCQSMLSCFSCVHSTCIAPKHGP